MDIDAVIVIPGEWDSDHFNLSSRRGLLTLNAVLQSTTYPDVEPSFFA